MYKFENKILDFLECFWLLFLCDVINRIGLFRDDINIYFMTFMLYLPTIREIIESEV